jgi:hypothetical protein
MNPDMLEFMKAMQQQQKDMQQQQKDMLQQNREKEVREQQLLHELARQREEIRELKTQSLTAGSAREHTPAFSVPIYQTYRDNDRGHYGAKEPQKGSKNTSS